MGLRDRHEQRKEERREFGIGGTAARFQMRQKMLAFGDDFWIQNGDGQRVYRIDGKVMRLRHTMDFEDAHGDKLCRIQTRVMHIRDTMVIEDVDGNKMASVHQALITPLRERWKVDVEDGEDWRSTATSSITSTRSGRRTQGRRGLQAVVPRPRHLRRTGGSDSEPGADLGCQRSTRRNGSPGKVPPPTFSGGTRQKPTAHLCSRGGRFRLRRRSSATNGRLEHCSRHSPIVR